MRVHYMTVWFNVINIVLVTVKVYFHS